MSNNWVLSLYIVKTIIVQPPSAHPVSLPSKLILCVLVGMSEKMTIQKDFMSTWEQFLMFYFHYENKSIFN